MCVCVWGGGGHSDPQIRKNPVSKKIFLAQFGLKIRGKSDPEEARALPLDPPLEAIASSYYDLKTLPLFNTSGPLRSGAL